MLQTIFVIYAINLVHLTRLLKTKNESKIVIYGGPYFRFRSVYS